MRDDSVIRSTRVVSSFTLLSRFFGMLRDILIAYFFGTSLMASAFFVAFTIPNLFRRLFGEGALSSAFIPIFIETRTREGDKAAWAMASKVVTMSAAVLTTIAFLGVIMFSILSQIPAFSDKWITTFTLSRTMFPYVVFICLAALFMAVLNSYRHFATPAFAPSLLNIVLIGAMLILFPIVRDDHARAGSLAWAVLLAGILQMTIQFPALKRFGCPFRFASHWNDPRVRKMLILMGPAALGMAVTQFNVLIDRFLAMWIGEWAPAALFYSERMIYFPLGLIATAMGTVLLPTFSTHAAEGDHSAMGRTINLSLRHLLFIMIPASLGLLALAPEILQTIFQWHRGSFDQQSTILSARALSFYAPGLVIFSAAKVFVPAFYATQDTRTPVRIGIYVVLLNLIMNITFILTFPEGWQHAGMAMATVLAEGIGITALAIILSRRINDIHWPRITATLVRSLLAGTVMAAAAFWTAHNLPRILPSVLSAKISQLITVPVAIIVGALSYLLLSLLLRAPEIKEIKSSLRRK